MKIETVADLLKGGGLAAHFKKAAAFHKAKSDAHAAMSKTHSDYAAAMKAKHDGMDDGDANKAFVKAHTDLHLAKAAHHNTMAALHKDYGDHAGNVSGGMDDVDGKAAAAGSVQKCAHEIEMTKACKECKREDAPVATGDISKFMEQSFAAAMANLGKSADFTKMFEDAIKAKAMELLGTKVVPDGIRGALPDSPHGLTLVKRPGAPENDNEPQVDPELQAVVGE